MSKNSHRFQVFNIHISNGKKNSAWYGVPLLIGAIVGVITILAFFNINSISDIHPQIERVWTNVSLAVSKKYLRLGSDTKTSDPSRDQSHDMPLPQEAPKRTNGGIGTWQISGPNENGASDNLSTASAHWRTVLKQSHNYPPMNDERVIKRVVAALVRECATTQSAPERDVPDPTPCDQEAGYRFDHQNTGGHKEWSEMDYVTAIKTCSAAVHLYTCRPRFIFQLGRSIDRAQRNRISKDYSVSVRLYEIAQKMGSTGAIINIGDLHAFGRGFPLDKSKGIKFFDLAAKKGSVQFAKMLYARYLYGGLVDGYQYPVDYDKALSFLEIYAKKDPELSFLLAGELFGKSTEKVGNNKRAMELLEFAGEKDYVPAIILYAKKLDDGDVNTGRPRNPNRAARVYLTAVLLVKKQQGERELLGPWKGRIVISNARHVTTYWRGPNRRRNSSSWKRFSDEFILSFMRKLKYQGIYEGEINVGSVKEAEIAIRKYLEDPNVTQ